MNWNQVDMLEVVETYADSQKTCCQDRSVIANEGDLSEWFDEQFGDWAYGHRDDAPALREHFNDWTDGLCKDGTIHPAQYNAYTYVGKYQRYFD